LLTWVLLSIYITLASLTEEANYKIKYYVHSTLKNKQKTTAPPPPWWSEALPVVPIILTQITHA